MMIRAVFRVQCDGPCRGWLSWREGYVPGTDMRPEDHVVEPTAVRALNWPGERAARLAAQRLGWQWNRGGPQLCPECAANPLGIVIPPAAPCLGTHDTWAVCRECA
jgi:hypothetical protein